MSSQIRRAQCKKCEVWWPWVAEQAAAIKLIGHCIVCEDKEQSGALGREPSKLYSWLNENGIIVEALRRETKAGYSIEPCPRCLHRRDKGCDLCFGLGSIRLDVGKKDKSLPKGNGGDDE